MRESPSLGASCLIVQELSKTFRDGKVANDALSLEVRRGEVFGLLGPNGAGKTTLVKQIIGLLKPTRGRIELDGHDAVADPALARRLCAYLPQGDLPIQSLTMVQAAELVGRIRGGDATSVRRRTRELIDALELDEWTGTLGLRLSGGAKRLTGFLMACVWPAPLVILDEPTNDVDPLRRRLLWRQIRRLAEEGMAVLLVTHNVLEAEQSVHRLAVIDQGKILAQGTPSALKAKDRDRLRFRLTLSPMAATPEMPPFVRHHTLLSRHLHMVVDEVDASHAIEWARQQIESEVAEEYALGATSLEDVYIRLIGRDDALELAEGASP